MSDVKYTPNQVHLHDKVRYEPDQEYTVSEGTATYFVLNGWGSSPDIDAEGQPVAAETTLEVDSIVQDQKNSEA